MAVKIEPDDEAVGLPLPAPQCSPERPRFEGHCHREFASMSEFPWAFQQIEATTWAYVSSLLMLALFFKFSRLWSMRNLDLILLVLLAPGLLLYQGGVTLEREAAAELARLGRPVPLSLTSGGLLEASSPGGAPDAGSQSPNGNSAQGTAGKPRRPAAVPGDNAAEAPTDPAAGTLPAGPQEPPQDDPVDETVADPAADPVDELLDEHALEAGEVVPESWKVWMARRSLSHAFIYAGFLFLFFVAALFVIRLLLDELLVRRPLLDTNLTIGGLWLLMFSLLTFLVANIMVSSPTETDIYGAESAAEILTAGRPPSHAASQEFGPAYPLLHVLPVIPTMIRKPGELAVGDPLQSTEKRGEAMIWVAKLMAILSQFAIVAGLVVMGGYHFGSWQNGVGMATLYLMLPYTVQMAGSVDHILPGALLLWAVVLYRRPFFSGILFGLTMGLVYYPLFLLALWISFYWERGARRFLYGVGLTVLLLILSLLWFSTEERGFLQNLQSMFGVWLPRVSGLKGIWEFGWDPWFRLPILVAFFSLGVSLVAWPIRKTFGTLLAYNAALLVAVQFWHGYGGGLYMAWYLPLTIATFFRPSLHDRIAKLVVK